MIGVTGGSERKEQTTWGEWETMDAGHQGFPMGRMGAYSRKRRECIRVGGISCEALRFDLFCLFL